MVKNTDLTEAAASTNDLPNTRDIVGKDEEIPIRELFSNSFVQANTDFETFDEMVAASPSEADSADDMERVPAGTWDEFIAKMTRFDDEEEMTFAAMNNWVADQLNL